MKLCDWLPWTKDNYRTDSLAFSHQVEIEALFEEMVDLQREVCDLKMELNFYADKYKWNVKQNISGKL